MSENNLPNEELENQEAVNQNEEVTDSYEEATEAFEDEVYETEEAVEGEGAEEFTAEEAVEEAVVDPELVKAKKALQGFKTSAIIAWILVVILAAVDVFYFMTNIYNKYNHMGYLNVSGYTIGEVVSGMGMEFDEFKEMYGLPQDMKKDTYMDAAQALIPISKMAEMNGMDFAAFKEMYSFTEAVTEEMTWGEALETLTLKDYVGEEQFEEFKTSYELGEDVTLETTWGEIRKEVEKKQLAERLAEEEAAEPTAEPTQEPAQEPVAEGETAEDTATDAEAETEPVEEVPAE